MKKKADDRELHNKTGYQQGFSPEGAALLARPWIRPEPEPDFEDFTLAAYIEGADGYHWNDES